MTEAERKVRREFVDLLYSYEGAPYIWAGTGSPGFDCSGIGCRAAWTLELVPRSLRFTSRWIHRKWEPTESPELGDAVTYGWPIVRHVMWIVGPAYELPDPAGAPVRHIVYPVIGASGGGRLTTTVAKARAKGARVRTYPRHDYRQDVAGFRRLPIPAEVLRRYV